MCAPISPLVVNPVYYIGGLMFITMKPVSGRCNIDCIYCFYKDIDFGIMSDEIVHKVISQSFEPTTFGWQGGEPTLAGLDFYQRAIKVCPNYINHTMMTNGILIDENWAKLFKNNNFLVGVSIDGIESIHNKIGRAHV